LNLKLKHILIFAGISLICIFLWYISTIVAYVLIAALVSVIAQPAVKFICGFKIGKYHISKSIAAILIIIVFWALSVSFFRIFVPMVANQGHELSKISRTDVERCMEKPLNTVERIFGEFHAASGKNDSNFKEYASERIAKLMNASYLTDFFRLLTGLIGNIFVAIFSISFIAFFFIKDDKLFTSFILTLTPDKYLEKVTRAMESIKKMLINYLLGLMLDVTLIIILISVGMMIVGLTFEQAMIVGLIAGLSNFIPYIGPLIGAAFGLLLGVAVNINGDFDTVILPQLIYMLIVFVIVNLSDGMLLQPLIFSNSVKAHPLEIFLVIMIAGTLAGIPGMVLAIPVYTILRVIAKEFFYQFKVVKKITENI